MMMSEELYGVVFEDGGDRYLVAVFDVMSEAEREMERMEEGRYMREVEGGALPEADYETIYEVVELERDELDDSVFEQLERGLAVRIS
jgi:hypothetical protein